MIPKNVRPLREQNLVIIADVITDSADHPRLYLRGDHALAMKLRHELQALSPAIRGSEEVNSAVHTLHLWPGVPKAVVVEALKFICSAQFESLEVLI